MIATTIEQSKHLLELGLDPKTADMALCKGTNGELYPVSRELQEQANVPLANEDLAWSLSALLDVIKENSPELVCDGNKWYCGTIEYDTEYYPNKLDAVYAMVCWILKTRTD